MKTVVFTWYGGRIKSKAYPLAGTFRGIKRNGMRPHCAVLNFEESEELTPAEAEGLYVGVLHAIAHDGEIKYKEAEDGREVCA